MAMTTKLNPQIHATNIARQMLRMCMAFTF
jgi:hypothetical protein